MPVITITRGQHSGGEEIAENVAAKLGARCVSREMLTEAAHNNYNVPETKVSEFFEKSPSFWGRLTENQRTYLAYIEATLAERSQEDNLVYHGNAGQELLREVPHVLRVRLAYPNSRRVQRIMKEFGYSQEQSERFVAHIDDERTARMRYIFNPDWRDLSRYDIVLRLEKIPRDYAEEIILGLAKRPEFQLDEEKRGPFLDFLIKSRVHALLASRLVWIAVTVKNGVVTLEGIVPASETMVEQIAEEVNRIEGVKEVNHQITVAETVPPSY